MISISRLLCGTIGPGDHLRYREKPAAATAECPRPVVVWNCTRQCNLACVHCYATASNQKSPGEMSTLAGKVFINDLVEFGAPVILFSGGEPLARKDFFELAQHARSQGLRAGLSTNGTLITPDVAAKLKDIGFAEVGISLDGIGARNDQFRGKTGAFESALAGIRNCVALGIRVSLRLTITRFNYLEVPPILRLIEDEGIDRVCFYHLAYSGRGSGLQNNDIDHAQTRALVDLIADRTVDMHKRGLHKEILTVGNHADGVYMYLRSLRDDPERANQIMDLLKTNGGNNSGVRIGCVDDRGNVHPDQFWWHYSWGNVLNRKFGDIWSDTSDPIVRGLRDRKKMLKGRCAECKFLGVCNGNLRVRAEAVYDDVWAPDPACYLTDEEIGVAA
ncbi:MAG: heme d1 biosynthesis radical SAM protein NirJ1 [Chloroflexi bacterium RBG_16_57_8]|nr:MAG: heme d1 biosynthesis radical SAM protein NirJ1 [Chloroflexi bacterium RBG_16_57_8]